MNVILATLMAEVVTTPEQEVAPKQASSDSVYVLPSWFEQLKEDKRVRLGGLALIIIAVGVVGYGVYRSSQEENEQQASLLLSRVLPYIEMQQYDQALNGDPKRTVRGEPLQGLLAIIDTYGSTHAGKTAAFYAAQIFFGRKQYTDAEKYFEHAESSDALLVKVGAQAGLAACYERRNNLEEAARIYERILPEAEHIGAKDKYMLSAALCYEKTGQLDRARQLYSSLLAEFEFSEYASEAKAGLVRLGTVVEY